jgi:hypothetical protein
MTSEALWKRSKWDVSLLGYCRHLIDTLQKVGYGRSFLKSRANSSWSQRTVLLFLYLKGLSYWLNQTPQQAPNPSSLWRTFQIPRWFSLRKTNGDDGQRALFDHHHQLHLTLNSLFDPTQNSLFERNRTEWRFGIEPIITPTAVVGCRYSLTESRRPDSLSVCLCGWLSQPRFRVLMPIPHGRSESLWSQRLPQKEVDRKRLKSSSQLVNERSETRSLEV